MFKSLKRAVKRLFPREIVVRMFADALMVNAALLTALLLHYVWLIETEVTTASAQAAFQSYTQEYLTIAWLVTLVCLPVFYVSGFYTHGRMYRGRYKALAILQGVTLSYVIAGFAAAFFSTTALTFSRSVLVLSWLLTLLLSMTTRFWTKLWRQVGHTEAKATAVPAAHKKSVLVIGGAGYIGSALLPKLLARGYRVRLLDLLVFGKEPIAEMMEHPNLEIIQGDFLQVNKVVAAMRGVDAVIHLGAIVGDPACALDEDLTLEVNLIATRMIAEVAKGTGVERFIFASTCSVYGASDDTLDERSALNPVSHYARSKIASEKVLLQLSDDHFAPVILRFGTIFGLSGRTRFDLVVNLLTAKAMIDGKITVYGGDQWRPFVHVGDAASAVLRSLEAPLPAVRKQIFNVGSNTGNFTLGQVGEIVKKLVPSAELLDMGRDGDRRNYRVNFSKIQKGLGFEAEWTLERGCQQVIDSITSGRVRDYRDAKYSNVKSLQLHRTVQKAFITAFSKDKQFYYGENNWAYELINEPMSVPVAPMPGVTSTASAASAAA